MPLLGSPDDDAEFKTDAEIEAYTDADVRADGEAAAAASTATAADDYGADDDDDEANSVTYEKTEEDIVSPD